MTDPVQDNTGHSYERAAIYQWLENHNTSPITRLPLSRSDLVPNRALQALITEQLGNGTRPPIGTIHYATVKNIKQFGVFCSLPGYRKQGLVHKTQITTKLYVGDLVTVNGLTSNDGELLNGKGATIRSISPTSGRYRCAFANHRSVKSIRSANLKLAMRRNQKVWVQVLKHEDGEDMKYCLSMKTVNQATGQPFDEEEPQVIPPPAPQVIPTPELNSIHRGTVCNITNFGCFVSIPDFENQGLVHISELTKKGHVENVSDYVTIGQLVYVKVISHGDNSKYCLSISDADQNSGKDLNPPRKSGKPANYTIHQGVVLNFTEFGMFVDVLGYEEHGLVHNSEMDIEQREAFERGQQIWVKVINPASQSDSSKLSLTVRNINQNNGWDNDSDQTNFNSREREKKKEKENRQRQHEERQREWEEGQRAHKERQEVWEETRYEREREWAKKKQAKRDYKLHMLGMCGDYDGMRRLEEKYFYEENGKTMSEDEEEQHLEGYYDAIHFEYHNRPDCWWE